MKIVILILSIFYINLPTFAKENQSASTQALSHQSQEHWFYYLGVGIVPQPKFDSGIQSNIDSGRQANSWAGDYAGVLELPGVYYKFGQSTLVGLITNFIFENYSRDYRDQKSLGFDTYNISLSAMTSTGGEPGLGYFIRADVGPCDLIQIDEAPGGYGRTYFPGIFEQIAFGYGFQSSSNTRLLSHVNFFYEDVIGHYQTGVSLNIGFLL